MKRFSSLLFFILLIISTLTSCHRPKRYTLIVENASIFDTYTGKVIPNKTILISGDTIAGIVESGEPVRTKKVVDAEGRLVVPGNIDASMHLCDAFVDVKADVAPTHPKSLTSFYRHKFTKQFLPYGVTLALDMGQVDAWRQQTDKWQSDPMFTELLTASKISNEDLQMPVNELINQFDSWGIKYVYTDSTLGIDTLAAIVEAANSKGLVVFSALNPQTAFEGISRNVEGLSELLINMLKRYGNVEVFQHLLGNIFPGHDSLSVHVVALEAFNFLISTAPSVLESLAFKLGQQRVSITSSLHLMASQGGLLAERRKTDSVATFTREQKMRIEYNFKHLLSYVKQLYDAGVRFRIGSNTPNGGRAFIDEQIILAKAGIPVPDIIRMSSLETAEILRIDRRYGSIATGKKADMIIYEQNPLDDYRCFETPRRVIKNGRIYRRNRRRVELEEIK